MKIQQPPSLNQENFRKFTHYCLKSEKMAYIGLLQKHYMSFIIYLYEYCIVLTALITYSWVIAHCTKPSPLSMLPLVAPHYHLGDNLLEYADNDMVHQGSWIFRE